MISRRSLFVGGATLGVSLLIAAPSIVRPRSLMPIRPMIWDGPETPLPNTVMISNHWADGSYYKELANLDNRESNISFHVQGLDHYKGFTDLQAAENILKRINEIQNDPHLHHRLVAFKEDFPYGQ